MRTEDENYIPSFLALQEPTSTTVGEHFVSKARKKQRGKPKPLGLSYPYKAGILRRYEILSFNGMLSNHLSVQQPAGTLRAQPALLP